MIGLANAAIRSILANRRGCITRTSGGVGTWGRGGSRQIVTLYVMDVTASGKKANKEIIETLRSDNSERKDI